MEGTLLGREMVLRLSEGNAIASVGATLKARLLVLDESGKGHMTIVMDVPRTVSTMLSRLEEVGVTIIPPMIWEHGVLRLCLLALEAGPLSIRTVVPGAILESKSSLEKREIDAVLSSSGLMLPSLTRKQARAVLAALEAGYYDAPRKVTTEEVARMLGIARSTFEEHLKAAESKLISALAPVVRVRLMQKENGQEVASAEALKVFAQFSDDLGLYVSLAIRNGKVVRVGLSEQKPAGTAEGENQYLSRIIKHIESGEDDLTDIPLELPITPFEKEVLELLRKVPPGEVVTYGELARRVGRPKASRAVGHACASNPAVIVVPCHRVVPASGGLGNYSAPGGRETKRRLLEKEGALRKVRDV